MESREVRSLTQYQKSRNPSDLTCLQNPKSSSSLRQARLTQWQRNWGKAATQKPLMPGLTPAQPDTDLGQHNSFLCPLAATACCVLGRSGPGPGLGHTFKQSSLVTASSWVRWLAIPSCPFFHTWFTRVRWYINNLSYFGFFLLKYFLPWFPMLIPRQIVLEVWTRNSSRWLTIHFPPETQVASDLPHLHPAESGWREIRRLSLHAQSLGYSSLTLAAYRNHHGSFKNCLCLGRLTEILI